MFKKGIIGTVAACLWLSFAMDADAKPNLPWLTFAPEVGYQFYSGGELEKAYGTRVPARHGVLVKGHVDLGGDAWAVELVPLYSWERCRGKVGNLNALGGEVNLVYRFNMTKTYPHLGLGFRGAYLFPNDNIKAGNEVYGRVPVGITWYFVKYIALVLDAGFMFGGTGIRFKENDDPETSNLAGKTEYAFTLGFDALIGIRFP
jgi:hypothetical protein